MACCLEGLAGVAGFQGEPVRAAGLWGAAEGLRGAIGASLPDIDRRMYERYRCAVRARVGGDAWTAAWEEGRAMTPERAIGYALGEATKSLS